MRRRQPLTQVRLNKLQTPPFFFNDSKRGTPYNFGSSLTMRIFFIEIDRGNTNFLNYYVSGINRNVFRVSRTV